VGGVKNQVGDVPCFFARPDRLGWGNPFAADDVVKFIVVGDPLQRRWFRADG
jgi:hypothetical protein